MSKIKYKHYGYQKNWIHGEYEQSNSKKRISVVSPYFGKEIATVSDSNSLDLEKAIKKANKKPALKDKLEQSLSSKEAQEEMKSTWNILKLLLF